jgi:surfeit locus 1 family protein
MSEASPRASAGVLGPALVALAAFIVLIGLGTWQLERKAWKEGLIAALHERLSADAEPLPARWGTLDQDQDEFRRVSFSAVFAADEALVYANASTFRPDVSGPGYWVFAPARLADGTVVVVNRGFVPEGQQAPTTHPPPAGSVQLVGTLRWPEPRGWFSPNDDPARNLWFVRDQLAMAAAKRWGNVAPFYIELETSTGTLPRAGRLVPSLRNEHLQYAITWYALAAVLAISFGFWLRSRQ